MTILVRDVYKIFGPDPARAHRLMAEGATREDLRRTGHTAAVVDANLEIEDGEIFVIMGLSGSGKSTLVRTLNRLIEPTSGSISIDGTDVSTLPDKELRKLRAQRISMVFQHFALLPHRSVRDNAMFGLRELDLSKDEQAHRADEALETSGLAGWGDSYPDELSGGMRQRVGLARALATGADILLMDEAFSALDPLIKREMQDQLLELQSDLQRTIVFITHDLNEAMRLGDRIAVMRDGQVVQVGTSEEILQTPADDYVASFVQDVDRSRVISADGVMVEPQATIGERAGPAAAVRKMRDLQVSALYVVDARRRLVGIVHDEEAAMLLRQGARDLSSAIRRDPITVKPDDMLADLLTPSAESPLPLAVVDDAGIFLGVVARVSLLAALSSEPSGQVPAVELDPSLTTVNTNGEPKEDADV